jgi:hypothetical protein
VSTINLILCTRQVFSIIAENVEIFFENYELAGASLEHCFKISKWVNNFPQEQWAQFLSLLKVASPFPFYYGEWDST